MRGCIAADQYADEIRRFQFSPTCVGVSVGDNHIHGNIFQFSPTCVGVSFPDDHKNASMISILTHMRGCIDLEKDDDIFFVVFQFSPTCVGVSQLST